MSPTDSLSRALLRRLVDALRRGLSRLAGVVRPGMARGGAWAAGVWARAKAGLFRIPRGVRWGAGVGLLAAAVLGAAFAMGTGQEWRPDRSSSGIQDPAVAALEASLTALIPARTFVVVDQTHNRLHLWQDRKPVHEAICSAGSGVVLRDGPTGRKWVFDTPRGRFSILKKVKNPVWTKPDWAFIEEGKRPPRRAADRVEKGVLGEYALHLGDGYMIHGTLYERLLGRSVTHGCIRLGREDLRRVFEAVEVGTPVFIF